MSQLKQALFHHHLLFFMLIAFVLYGNTLGNQYAIDDSFVTNNALTNKGFKAIPKIFRSHYATAENGQNYEYRPIVTTTYAIEYALFRQNPAISHFINIVLYGICLWLLYHFLRNFLPTQTDFGVRVMVCMFAALPIHTEVVASLKNRDVLLAFMFTFMAINTLHRYFETGKIYHVLLALCYVVAGFLSKLDILSFIVAAPVLFIGKYDLKKNRRVLFSCVFLAGGFLFVLLKRTIIDQSSGARSFRTFETPLLMDHSWPMRIKMMLVSSGFYIKNLIFPSDLACYYGAYTLPLGWWSLYTILTLLAVMLLVWFISRYRKERDLWIGVLLFVLPVSMYLNIVRPVPGIVGDRFAFFASVGFCIVACYFLLRPGTGQGAMPVRDYKQLGSARKYILVIFLISGVVITVMRNRDWKNKLSLYETDVKKWPTSVKLNVLYANEIVSLVNTRQTDLIKRERFREYIDKARKHLLTAYTLDSSYYNIPNTLAYIDMTYFNRPGDAIGWLYKAARTDTINYEIPLNLCLCYLRLNNPDSMEKYFSRTAAFHPDNLPRLVQQMKNTYRSMQDTVRGDHFFQKLSLGKQ